MRQDKMIPFNKPYLSGKELEYIKNAIARGHISGNGYYTKKCHEFFTNRYGFKKCLLTTSCTDALEMCGILLDIKPGDEVIVPSFTFVSTANAFVLRGAKIVFADSLINHPNIDPDQIEPLITKKTKAIVVVHYAGVACDMDRIIAIANRYNLFVVEDAAQAINSFYKGKPLGSFGHLATFSFHETKNIICGEGGMLVINDERFEKRAEIIWEKGTNRTAFFRGEIDKYGWVDVGSSFLPSDVLAAFLLAQLQQIDKIQERRNQLWKFYYTTLKSVANSFGLGLPTTPDISSNNAHIFFLLCRDQSERDGLIAHLRERGIMAVFHYLPLETSNFFKDEMTSKPLPNSDRFSKGLVRLPLFYKLTLGQQRNICQEVGKYYEQSMQFGDL